MFDIYDEYVNVQFAALLHDIGKFFQRTGIDHSQEYQKYTKDDFGWNGAHGKWGADFTSQYWNDDIQDLVLYHHNPNQSNYPGLCKLVQNADHYSSSERISSEDKQDTSKTPLSSIFSRIAIDDNELIKQQYVPLQSLNINKSSFDYLKPRVNPLEKGEWNLQPEYKSLWNAFENEFKLIKNHYDFSTVLSILRKYTSTIPSAVYVSQADISLYDHLKTTAAIASCSYLFDNESDSKDKNKFIIINGDISGIQKFIYRVSSPQEAQSGMSKRLRGRSIYISLLNEAIASRIIKNLNLTEANILFCGGGRFVIIAPNTRKSIEEINKIKNEINRYFISNFNAELYLALVYAECKGEDLSSFGEITSNLSNLLNEDKKHKFSDNLNEIFTFDEKPVYNTCSVCGNPTDNENQKICASCIEHEHLGAIVGNREYMIKYYSNTKISSNSIFFESLNIGFTFRNDNNGSINKVIEDLASKSEFVEVIKLNDTDFTDLASQFSDENISFSFSFLGNTIPKAKATPLYFEHLATVSKGANKLGVLKMDVDDLGKIFSQGFNKLSSDESSKGGSISRVSSLSSMLDLFFSGIINEISKNYRVYTKVCDNCKDKVTSIDLVLQNDNEDEEPKSITVYKEKTDKELCEDCEKYAIPTIHINYSGGDDLLVIGPYDDIIKFAQEFRDKFKKWSCNNPSINISGGISIVGPKFPIGKAVGFADTNLEHSKSCGKDKITLFDQVLRWDSNDVFKGFNDLIEYGEELEEYNNKNQVSMGIIYSMLQLWNQHINKKIIPNSDNGWEKENFRRLNTKAYVPYIKYKLRLIKNKTLKDEIDKKTIKSMPWINIPVSWASLRMR